MLSNHILFKKFSRSTINAFFCYKPTSFNYHEKVIDHYENPRNVGSLDKSEKNVGTGLVGAPACGDVMKLQIKVDENGVIQNAVFKVTIPY